MTEASVLAHFDARLETIIESDSSDYVSAEVLSQKGEDEVIRPVAFFSKTLLSAECNYEIYDKELLAIIRCFEEWRPELQSVEKPIKILIDHKALKYFMTTKKLNRRQVRWAEFLADFDFVVSYQAGKIHAKADSFTRKPDDKPTSDENDRQKHQVQTILTSDRLDARIKNDLQDLYLNEIAEERASDASQKTTSITDSEIEENGLAEKLFISEDKRLAIIKEVHNQPAVGHSGIRRTTQMLQRFFQWPKMRCDVDQYIRNCHVCRRSKSPRNGYHGPFQPIAAESKPWQDISLDFVVGLSESEGCNAILMIMDRFSKMHHYIPCKATDEKTGVEETAKLLFHHVWKVHGLPKTIILDRGPQFIFLIWQKLCKMLGIKSKLSTAFHPEIDGQSEKSNQKMERYLRAYVNYQQDDWFDWLLMAEFASNASESASTKLSPFFVNNGFELRMSFEPLKIDGTARERISGRKAASIKDVMKNIWAFAAANLHEARRDQETYANRHKKSTPTYEPGDRA